ncbi:MAG: serine hydrolase [candidate division Zixibacteria bacterium]|nr:serine hydrolase [candidate division Zixibacteria bacterium]
MRLVAATAGAAITIAVLAGCFWARPFEYNQLDRYLTAAHDFWGFQGSALVSYKGRVLLKQGYGWADAEFEDPNTPRTRFFIGSITKQFTAAAILLLAQEGKLRLDDPITDYLSDYPENPGHRITIRHCLTHTSGLPNYTEIPEVYLQRTSVISQTELLELFRIRPLDFEPGTEFHYSNSGYIVLGAIIEQVSGQSYEAFLHHRILKPLGMLNSGYARRSAAVPERAHGYTIDDTRSIVDAVPVSFSVLHTAGALYSTVEDMLKWDRALYTNSILDETFRAALLTPRASSYAYGWYVELLYGRRHAFHGGFLDGFNTTFERWPDDSLCVIVFSNEDEAPVRKIARGLAAIVFNEEYTFPEQKTPGQVDPAILSDYVGMYSLPDSALSTVYVDNGTLYEQQSGRLRQALIPQAPDTFFSAADNTRLYVFARDRDGLVVAQVVIDEGKVTPAARIEDSETGDILSPRTIITLDSTVLDRYTGTYALHTDREQLESRFLLTVTRHGDHLAAAVAGQTPVEIYPSTATEFFHRQADFRIQFVINESGATTGCVLRLGGAEVSGVLVK